MFGNNPIRKPVKGDGSRLDVKHIFPTIQGEGPLTGVPAIFVRLAGCNLACEFCDTEFDDGKEMMVPDIIKRVQELTRHHTLVVITGGEPLRQPIEKLCLALLVAGYRVQVETNGTIFRDLPDAVDIVCSPKNTSGSYVPVREDLLSRTQALKFIISAHVDGYDHIADVGQSVYGTPVFVQPMDEYDAEKNKRNTELARELAVQEGARLSLQVHKIMGLE